MELPIKVTWPPMLYTDMQGRKWAVSGQHWLEVPHDMTLDRVDKYMVVDQRFTPAQSPDVRTYEVQGSTGSTYTVTQDGDTWTCTCPGFGWRRKCRHIGEVQNESR